MLKNNINFKLVNIAIVLASLFLIYLMADLWFGIFNIISTIFKPFFLAIIFVYSIYPLVIFLEKYKINRKISIPIIYMILILTIYILLYNLLPILFNEIIIILTDLIKFTIDVTNKYGIEINHLNNIFNNLILYTGNYITAGSLKVINGISVLFIGVFISIYLLYDINNIKTYIKGIIIKSNSLFFQYINLINYELRQYVTGFFKIIIITFFEYLLFFLIIKHPYYLFFSLLAAISNLVPIVGGIVVSLLSVLIIYIEYGWVKKTMLTIIGLLILSLVDSYLINPVIYQKSNKLHPVLIISSVFISGYLFGMTGVILGLPITIILITTLKFLKENK